MDTNTLFTIWILICILILAVSVVSLMISLKNKRDIKRLQA